MTKRQRTAERRELLRKRHIPLQLNGRKTLEARAGDDDETKTIAGYGAVFYNANDPGTEFRIWSDYYERIMPGAFDRALDEDDVRSLYNHDSNFVLGRRALVDADTLKLSVDETGLRYEVDPPAARADVVEAIGRGDVTGSSFMFIPDATSWREETRGEGDDRRTVTIREIESVELWELGPVVFPAYESATSELRVSRDDSRIDIVERDRWFETQRRDSLDKRRALRREIMRSNVFQK